MLMTEIQYSHKIKPELWSVWEGESIVTRFRKHSLTFGIWWCWPAS
jgi:hypothetical protein